MSDHLCRFCTQAIHFAPLGPNPLRSDWDWLNDRATRCTHASGRHYPVNPVEGIDY